MFLKSYFGLNKMLFFGILSVLFFFKLSGKSDFWKTAVIHFARGRGGREVGSHDVDIIIGGKLLNHDSWGGGVKNL